MNKNTGRISSVGGSQSHNNINCIYVEKNTIITVLFSDANAGYHLCNILTFSYLLRANHYPVTSKPITNKKYLKSRNPCDNIIKNKRKKENVNEKP